MTETEHFELPEMPDYISTEQAAKLLGISKQRVYQYISEQRLPAFRAGNIILLPVMAVKQFKPNIAGRPRKKEPPWRIYRGGDLVFVTDIQVQVRAGQQQLLVEKLRGIQEQKRHTFPGTIARYVLKSHESPTTVNIWLIWKDSEMPDEETRQREFAAFQAEFADVLDWETAQAGTKEGIIYT